ncbi:DUF5667 domain-containing protein [Nocardioides sp. YIM 152315]|uniref:DUF5667 domain-containing protein n=1 Tax=Nocardioides sp. YIM 152315 TaxID=3031760 RepID=UPI0023DC0E24|nr:DUF5667 domain-containing protein [Nocardioides sp. YIM 152315]MDF1606147.1 DUF5667 domain-containing protein [Nocardioides sp. YIM 152315]
MTWGNRARRRAEEFAALVERSSTGERTDAAATRDSELLELVGSLRAVPAPEPRPEFVADLRARLMTEAETALVPDDLSKLRLPARRTARERRLAAVVGGLAIAGATASVAVAAQSALPGESLYPIKRVIESAHANLSPGEASKGSIELAGATDRLEEAAALATSDDLGAHARVAPTLATFSDQATRGADLLFADYAHSGREASIVKLRDFASGSLTRLEDLEPQVPADARDELIAAANVVAQIDAEAAQQCPDCGGTPIEAFPPSLTAAAPVELPTVPATAQEPRGSRGDGDEQDEARPGKGTDGDPRGDRGAEDSTGTDLPDVGGDVPPGSVLDPTTAPSPTASPTRGTNPVKALTEGLTGVLTGGATASSPASSGGGTGTTPTTGPLTGAVTGTVTGTVEGVTEILQGVLDPITGALLPPPPQQ